MMDYQHLFQEGKIGSLTVKNRIVMPPMGTNLAGFNGEVTDDLIAYYEERAKGGTGLIIVEFTCVDWEYGKGFSRQLRLDDDRAISGMFRLANALKKYGARVFVQIHHAGRQSSSALLHGKQIVAPSSIPCKAVGEVPRELTTEEVKDLVEKFVQAAVRAKLSGFDGVEIHAAHGYLINQFLSPNANQRTDEYGGSFENRMRFLEEIIVGIRKKCGGDFPLIVRLNVDDFVEGGIDLELGKEIAKYLEKLGADAIHATCGTYDSQDKIIESPLFEQGWRVYLAEEVKKVVDIPVITVGSIREPQFAERILAEGKADFVAIGRGLISDPEWARKAKEGRETEINKCINCLHCVHGVNRNQHIRCSINARAGREREFNELKPVPGAEKRHIVVVGGGPGGCEAAQVLRQKGYRVTLLEKTDKLGGQLNLVDEPTYRKKMAWYLEYMRNEMKRLEVDVRLNTEGTVENIMALEPDAVFLATGGVPRLPDVEGVDLEHVYTYEDIKLQERGFANEKITVIGSGLSCHGIARRLAEAGNQVTHVEFLTKTSKRMNPAARLRLQNKLKKLGVNVITGHKLVKIMPESVVVEDPATGKETEIESKYVVISMGIVPYNPLEKPLKEKMENVFVLGDALGYGMLGDAVRGGFEQAYVLESMMANK